MERMHHGGEGRLIPTGVLQEVNPTRQQHARETGDAAYEYAVKSHTHLWTVIVQHRATDAILDSHDGTTTDNDSLPILDADTMTGPPSIGCFVCEQGYEPRLRRRKCPGEPRV